MALILSDPATATVINLKVRAKNLRGHVLRMAEVQGQGYVGQGLGIADLLAVLYFHVMRYDPRRADWAERDRFVLSIGHYAIGLYAALAEAGILPLDLLDTYGTDGSLLEMSASERTPGVEMTGGSLGHGLSQAVGMALGLRRAGRPARVFNLLSDGELQEGSTWEAAMAGSHFGLDRLYALIDCNRMQADGPPEQVMRVEPVVEKWAAFGWDARRVDGNDVEALLKAFAAAEQVPGRPHALVLDTLMGKGVELFEKREKNHFLRVDPDEWRLARAQLETST